MPQPALRFGFVFNRFSEGLTLGVGFKSGRFSFDYGHGDAKSMKALSNATFSVEF